jgi:hypothetical protein
MMELREARAPKRCLFIVIPSMGVPGVARASARSRKVAASEVLAFEIQVLVW